MQFFKKMGVKFFGFIIILAVMLIFAIHHFSAKIINLPTFMILLLGCIGFIYINIIDRKKDLIIEEHELLRKAEEQVQMGEWLTAVTLFDRILILNPKSMKAMMGRAFCLKEKADYEQAIKQYDEVIAKHGGFYTIFFLKGVCCLRLRKFKDAKESLEKAIALKPNFSEPYLLLGDLYYTMNNSVKAEKCYQEYMKRCENEMLKALAREKIESLKNKKLREEFVKAREEAVARGEQVEPMERDDSDGIAAVDSSRILEALVSQMSKVEKVEDFDSSRVTKSDIMNALKTGLSEKEKAEILRILQADMEVTGEPTRVMHQEQKISKQAREEMLQTMKDAESGVLDAKHIMTDEELNKIIAESEKPLDEEKPEKTDDVSPKD